MGLGRRTSLPTGHTRDSRPPCIGTLGPSSEEVGAEALGDFVEAVARDVGPDFEVVFADVGRCESFNGQRLSVEEGGEAIDVGRSEVVVLDRLPERSGVVLGIAGEQVMRVSDTAGWHTTLLQLVDDLVRRLFGHPVS